MTERTRRAPRQAEAERNDQALLAAAREVIAIDGAHASVAAIAGRAGVGIGSLYRRYRTKEELFQRLLALSLEQWVDAAEQGLAQEDPWEGLALYVRLGVGISSGSLGALAGTVTVTPDMGRLSERSDALTEDLVSRALAAGVLRPDVTSVDLMLLIEQLGKSPLRQAFPPERAGLVAAAGAAADRMVTIALDGLRAGPDRTTLPGDAPGPELFEERWTVKSR